MSKAVPARPTLWTKNYILIFAANFVTLSAANMFTSPYALHMASLGGTDMDVGVSAFIYAIVSLLMKPVAAWFLDNRSRKKIYLFGLLGMAGTFSSYILAPLVLLIILRGFQGMFFAWIITSSTTNGYDTINQERFSEGVGYLGFSNAMATTLMPTVGLWIYNSFGYTPFFLTLAGLCLASILILTRFRFEKVDWQPAPKLREINVFDLVIEKRAFPPSMSAGFSAIVNAAISNYMALYLKALQVDFSAGLYFMMQGLGTFTSRTFIGRVMEKKGEEPIIITCCITLVLGLLGVIQAETLPLFLIGAFLLGLGLGLSVTCTQIMSARSVPKEHRAKAAATYSCAWEFFVAIGGLLAGVLVTAFSYRTTFWLMMIMSPLYYVTYKFWVAKSDCAFKVMKAREKAQIEARLEEAKKRAEENRDQ